MVNSFGRISFNSQYFDSLSHLNSSPCRCETFEVTVSFKNVQELQFFLKRPDSYNVMQWLDNATLKTSSFANGVAFTMCSIRLSGQSPALFSTSVYENHAAVKESCLQPTFINEFWQISNPRVEASRTACTLLADRPQHVGWSSSIL